MSEVFGGALRRDGSDSFVLDPFVLGEVVDDAGCPVSVGEAGELTLTELFPFVQAQPLVRYRTGDIVGVAPSSNGDLAFQWWGRRSRCARPDDSPTWAVAYSALSDLLSMHPLVARQSYRPGIQLISSNDVGPPVFRFEFAESRILRVEVGLRAGPWLARDSIQSIVRDMQEMLSKLSFARHAGSRLACRFRHVTSPELDAWESGEGHRWLEVPTVPLCGISLPSDL